MPDYDFVFEPITYRQPPQIPSEWITMVCKLHPVTAAVVWQVLNWHHHPLHHHAGAKFPRPWTLYVGQHRGRW